MSRITERRQCQTWAYALTRAKQLTAYSAAYSARLDAAIESARITEQMKELERQGSAGNAAAGADRASPPSSPSRAEMQQRMNRAAETGKRTAVLMRQIEREQMWSYQQLHAMRERVFHRHLAKYDTRVLNVKHVGRDMELVSLQKAVDTAAIEAALLDDLASPRDEVLPSPAVADQTAAETGPGFYGWLSSWWSAPPSEPAKMASLKSEDSISSANMVDALEECERIRSCYLPLVHSAQRQRHIATAVRRAVQCAHGRH